MSEAKTITKKICLIGDGAVGKTSLISRFVHNRYDDKYIQTIGTKVSRKNIRISDDLVLILLIYDVLGQKRVQPLHDRYYLGSSGVIVVCDITRRPTVEHVESWLKSFYSVVGYVPTICLANKTDLMGSAQVTKESYKMATERLGCPGMFTSAKTGENVEKAFSLLAEKLLDNSR